VVGAGKGGGACARVSCWRVEVVRCGGLVAHQPSRIDDHDKHSWFTQQDQWRTDCFHHVDSRYFFGILDFHVTALSHVVQANVTKKRHSLHLRKGQSLSYCTVMLWMPIYALRGLPGQNAPASRNIPLALFHSSRRIKAPLLEVHLHAQPPHRAILRCGQYAETALWSQGNKALSTRAPGNISCGHGLSYWLRPAL
jgi:hypothetical protein